MQDNTPPPDPGAGRDPELLNYQKPAPRAPHPVRHVFLAMGIYVASFMFTFMLMQPYSSEPAVRAGSWKAWMPEWLEYLMLMAIPLGPPLLVAWRMRSRPMAIAAITLFGIILLSCGTCFAMLYRLHP